MRPLQSFAAQRRSAAAQPPGPASPGVRELGGGWVAVWSVGHGREYFWHRPTGVTSWQAPRVGEDPASAAAPTARTGAAAAEEASIMEVARADGEPSARAAGADGASARRPPAVEGAAPAEGAVAEAQAVERAAPAAAPAASAAPRLAAVPTAGSPGSPGVVAAQAAAGVIGAAAGAAVVSAAAAGTDLDASARTAAGVARRACADTVCATDSAAAAVAAGALHAAAVDAAASASRAPVDSASIAAAGATSAASSLPGTAPSDGAAPEDGRLSARGLPDGWVAVFSAAHQREYFWHRPSGATSWVAPDLQPAPQLQKREASDGADLHAVAAKMPLKRLVAQIKRKYQVGQELHASDFAVIRALLDYHPDSGKVGCGVHSIRMDVSLHTSGSACFWLLRPDGSAEDFSVRKCLDAFEESVNAAGGKA